MSQFFTQKFAKLAPYTPGEQPASMEKIIKLNTNESPFTISESAQAAAHAYLRNLRLYPDPTYLDLRRDLASVLNASTGAALSAENIVVTNGSDEALDFAIAAWCDAETPAVFPDITYGFYPVFAAHNCVPYQEIPLKADFTVDVDAFVAVGESGTRATIVVANPNAPTGLLLGLADIERIVAANPQNVVVVDEAYIDFGGESAITLIARYPNLVVTQTFSKSRSMAGARLGFAVSNPALIADLNTLRNSLNPYNVNSATVAFARGVLADNAAVERNCACIANLRDTTAQRLRALGFEVTPSKANFIFAKTPLVDGEQVYAYLKERNILVRHFANPRIADYNRITVGTPEEMDALVEALADLVQAAKQEGGEA